MPSEAKTARALVNIELWVTCPHHECYSVTDILDISDNGQISDTVLDVDGLPHKDTSVYYTCPKCGKLIEYCGTEQ